MTVGIKAIWRSVLAAAFLLGSIQAHPADMQAADVMAAYLRYIAALSSWPAETMPADDSAGQPILIGVVGEDPNGVMIPIRTRVESEEGLLAQNRPIGIVDLKSPAEDSGVLASCALLFLSEDAGDEWQQIQTIVDSKTIITVSELEGFARQGGMVEFFIDRRTSKVRMKINLPAVQEAGITISARILALESVIVLGEGEDQG
jgi:hypothetical protein